MVKADVEKITPIERSLATFYRIFSKEFMEELIENLDTDQIIALSESDNSVRLQFSVPNGGLTWTEEGFQPGSDWEE